MKFFDSLEEAATYAADELIATLEDDLQTMTGAQDHLYTDADRKEMAARLHDIRAVAPLMAYAPEVLKALKACLQALNEAPAFRIPVLGNKSSYTLAHEITLLIRRVEGNGQPLGKD